MPYEIGGYRELRAYRLVRETGLLKALPGFGRMLMFVQIGYANWPSGWVWVGKGKGAFEGGLSWLYWLKGQGLFERLGLYEAWGWKGVRGGTVLAFKLTLKVAEELDTGVRDINSFKQDVQDVLLNLSVSSTSEELSSTFRVSKQYVPTLKELTSLKNPKEPTGKPQEVTKVKDQEKETPREPAMDREDLHRKAQELIKKLAKKKGIP